MKTLALLSCLLLSSQSLSAASFRSDYKANLCLSVNSDPTSGWRFGVNVEVATCGLVSQQQFQIQNPVSVERGFTIAAANGKCLDIDQADSDDDEWRHNNNILVGTCSDSVTQQFDIVPQRDGWFSLKSRFDGRCLDIDLNNGNGWRYETNVHLWTCHGEFNQLWLVDE